MIPRSLYTLSAEPSFRIARSSATTVATAPSIRSVDFSLSILIFFAGSVRTYMLLGLTICYEIAQKRGENAPKNAKMMVYNKRFIDHHTWLPVSNSNPRGKCPLLSLKQRTVLFLNAATPSCAFCCTKMLRRAVCPNHTGAV